MSDRTFVRCADPGRSFIDHATKLHIGPHNPVDEVVHMTAHTREWIHGGGLVKLTPEEVEAHLATKGEEEEEQEPSDDSSLKESGEESEGEGEEEEQEGEEEPAGETSEPEEDSLEAILKAGEGKSKSKK